MTVKHAVLGVALVAAPLLFMTSRAEAIQINVSLEDCEPNPLDPDGAQLLRHAQAAAEIWMRALPADDSTVYNIDICWDHSAHEESSDATLGSGWPPPWFGIWIELAPPQPWFFDPDPLHSTAYNMKQTLFRDLSMPQQQSFFEDDAPPQLLEVGFTGLPAATGDGPAAVNKIDLLTVIVHEIGHKLGINYAWGEDYDIESWLIGGFSNTDIVAELDHLACLPAVMSSHVPTGLRKLPSAVDLFALVDDEDYTSIRLQRMDLLGNAFNILPEMWDNATNWEGGALPSSETDVFLRKKAMVFGDQHAGTLSLGFPFDLPVDQGLSLELVAGAQVSVASLASIAPTERASINVAATLQADSVDVHSGQVILVGGDLVVDAFLRLLPVNGFDAPSLVGHGIVAVGASLWSQGDLIADDMGTGEPLLVDTSVGTLDLDAGGTGVGRVFAEKGDVTFRNGITGPFSGLMQIGGGRRVTFGADLTLQKGGTLALVAEAPTVATFVMAPGPHAGLLTAHGSVSVDGHGAVDAALRLAGDGNFVFAPGSQLDLRGFTTYHTATCATHGQGTLRQLGDAEVTFSADLDVDTFDMDGDGTTRTTIAPNAQLTIAAHHLGDDDRFHGTVDNQGGWLTVHTTEATSGSDQPWIVGQHGVVRLDSSKVAAVVAGSNVTLVDRGHVVGTGTFATDLLSRGGIVEPAGVDGDPIGVISTALKQNYSQGGDAELWMDLVTGKAGKRNDLLKVTGTAWLGGWLRVTLIGPEPKLGEYFDVVVARDLVGTFSNLDLPVLTDLAWDVQYLIGGPGGVDVVRLVVVPHP